MYIYLNGTLQSDRAPSISHADRGFLLGDGVFETLKIIHSQPIFLVEHLERLSKSIQFLSIPWVIDIQAIHNALSELITLNQLQDQVASARITVTRGPGPRGLLPPAEVSPTLLITVTPYPERETKPIALWISSIRKNEFSPFSGIKSTACAENIFARMEAAAHQADDALFLNTQGFVSETTMCNIFIIQNGTLITPPITEGVLPGIMRGQLINIAKKLGLPIREARIALEDCYQAEGMFVTNALIDLKSVASINGRPIALHSYIPALLLEELQKQYRAQ